MIDHDVFNYQGLPTDLKLKVLAYCPIETLLRLSRVSQSFRQEANQAIECTHPTLTIWDMLTVYKKDCNLEVTEGFFNALAQREQRFKHITLENKLRTATQYEYIIRLAVTEEILSRLMQQNSRSLETFNFNNCTYSTFDETPAPLLCIIGQTHRLRRLQYYPTDDTQMQCRELKQLPTLLPTLVALGIGVINNSEQLCYLLSHPTIQELAVEVEDPAFFHWDVKDISAMPTNNTLTNFRIIPLDMCMLLPDELERWEGFQNLMANLLAKLPQLETLQLFFPIFLYENQSMINAIIKLPNLTSLVMILSIWDAAPLQITEETSLQTIIDVVKDHIDVEDHSLSSISEDLAKVVLKQLLTLVQYKSSCQIFAISWDTDEPL